MSVWTRLVAAVALGAASFIATATAQEQTLPPIEAYTSGARVSSVALSSDGRRLAVITATYTLNGDRAALQVVNLESNEIERAFETAEGALIGSAFWINDRQIGFMAWPSMRIVDGRNRGNEGRGFGLYDVNTGDQRLIQTAHFGAPYWLPGDPTAVRFVGYTYDSYRGSYNWASGLGRGVGVIRADLQGGGNRRIAYVSTDEDKPTVDMLFNDDGDLLARVDTEEGSNRWRFIAYEGGELRTVLEGVDEIGRAPDLVGVLADGRWAIINRNDNEDRWRMYAFDRNTNQFEAIASHESYDVSVGIRDRWTNRVVGASWTEDFPRQQFFDPALQAAYDHLQGVFADGYAFIQSWSRDRSRMVVFGETPEDAGTYYVFDAGPRTLRVVRRTYPEITGVAALGNRQAITYRAQDGTRIPAYLTLPVNAERNVPLVVMPHGGPHVRDDFTFDPMASFLASRGYAVLQPNYRGSTGYGYAYFHAGRGNWGDGVMQTDVTDGVGALVRAGIADPNRICIMGGSYGGYAALAGATLTPDLYRCAISLFGVSDVLRMLDETALASRGGPGSLASDWWKLSIGDRRADREHLRAISPVNLADRVRIPILLMHGKEDQTVPVEQSRIMRDALRAAGKDVELIEIDHEFHGFLFEENRTREFREVEAFLARHIGPGGAPEARRQ